VQLPIKNILKPYPALIIVVPLVIGILLQFHFSISFFYIAILLATSVVGNIAFLLASKATKFAKRWVQGIFIFCAFIALGAGLAFAKSIKNNPNWVGNYFKPNMPVLVTLQENLVAKQKSFKALATINAVYINNHWQQVNGDVLLYFKKDSFTINLQYGSQIVITKNLVSIVNSGNPGGFNYALYCGFQNIYHQAFLQPNNYKILNTKQTNWGQLKMLQLKSWVLQVLKNNIHSPNELGIAQALLIGYRDELDRDLVKAYSNTGVVHIIAISGLHLGMIYGLLLFILKPFKRYKSSVFLQPLIIIFVLWMFSFLAGMAPSILRSAIMFTCIVIGDSIGKKTNIYNSLALSALVILLINPYSLWDVGFQLSYAAVLSILLFSPYIKKWFFVKNKLLLGFLNLNAITLAAQILTLPLVLFHFHQFPFLFLVTNLMAVPLSGIILYAELLLIAINFIAPFATFIGKVIEFLIGFLNKFILAIDSLPFGVWHYIQISIFQSIILFILLLFFTSWLINKRSSFLLYTLASAAIFFGYRAVNFIEKNNQQKLIVYNVPSHTAIDVVEGKSYFFIGDSLLNQEGFLQNFHILPSRVLNRISPKKSTSNIAIVNNYFISASKKIVLINKPIGNSQLRQNVDAIIVSKNPKIYIDNLLQKYNCPLLIFDGSNPTYKINNWIKACDSLQVKYHVCSLQGSYEIEM
jgi:competence protein ComEC